MFLLLGLRTEAEQQPVLYIVEFASVSVWPAYLELATAEGEAAVLDALAPGVSDPRVIAAMRAALDNAAQLNPLSSMWLAEGLRLIGEGPDWALALPDLFFGLEGAIRDAARAEAVLDSREHFTPKTGRGGKADGVEAIVDHLGLADGATRLLKTRAYGKGNDFRHASAVVVRSPRHEARRQAVYLLLGLALWIERFVNESVIDVLSEALDDHTPERSLKSAR